MLILSRRNQEAIKIQDHITIHVLEIRGQSVKLGFSAPNDVAIHRSEIYQKIQAEKKMSDKI